MLLGTAIGLAAGHYGGIASRMLMAVTDWFIALPALPLAISLAAVLGQGDTSITIAIAVTSWPGTARLIRAQTLAVEARPFIERAKALGAGDRQLVFRQVLPNVAPLILVSSTLTVAGAILSATTLTFLGLGNPTDVSWGSMINQALGDGAVTQGAWWYVLPPGIAILIVVLGIHAGRAGGREDPEPTHAEGAVSSVSERRGAGGMSPLHADEDPQLLEVRDLAVTYRAGGEDVRAVRHVGFTLAAGQTLGMAGESGCGKTTVALSLLRLLPPTARVSGQILFKGEDVVGLGWQKLRAIRWARASVVFQGAMSALNPVQTIGEQIREPILLHEKVSRRDAEARSAELLDSVGVPSARQASYPHELSGGQRQRVMIAMALACRPDLIIADEPTTALDVIVQAQILALLTELVRERRIGMIVISHDLSVLGDTCELLAVMYAGKIVEIGRPASCSASRDTPIPGSCPEPSRALAIPLPGSPRQVCPASRPTSAPSVAGCPFAPRCPEALPECLTREIELWPAGPNRRSACVKIANATDSVGAPAGTEQTLSVGGAA